MAGSVADLTQLAGAAEIAMPDVAEALGSTEPKRYLVAALNDAEAFGSGGAPLSAFVVQADKGSLSVPISGQLESKLSPNNPPIDWKHEGGPPWYREGKRYPFVNSNFHPDFGTASVDMRRAWAALGYPEVDGVVTVDMSALASMLAWTGAVESPGFGEISSETLLRTVLVDAYRQFNSPEGVIERHARNEELTKALVKHLTQPLNLMSAVRGTMDAIPPRHIQASFDAPYLQDAVDELAAGGELSQRTGRPDRCALPERPQQALGVPGSSHHPGGAADGRGRRHGPPHHLVHQCRPRGPGGRSHDLRRLPRPAGPHAGGLPASAHGHRDPDHHGELRLPGPVARTGPFPDERGGQVLWQGHETAPGDTTTVVMEYSLPAGTFEPGTYEVHADPQALAHPAELTVESPPAPGTTLPATPGWTESGAGLEWSGTWTARCT